MIWRWLMCLMVLVFVGQSYGQMTLLGKSGADSVLPGFFGTNGNTTKIVQGINANKGTNQFAESLIPLAGQNVGSGIGVYSARSGANLQFNSVVAGSGMGVELSNNAVVVSVTTDMATDVEVSAAAAVKVSTNNGPHHVIATGTGTSRRLQDRLAEVKNVLDFGALTNGTGDSTAAFQSAMDAVPELSGFGPWRGGGVIEVPHGAYKITGTLSLRPGTILRGAGRHPARLISYTTNALLRAVGGNDGTLNVVIENLLLDGAEITNSGNGIELLGAKECLVRNIEVWGFNHGLVISNAQVMGVRDCKFRDNRGDGVQTVGTCNALNLQGNYAMNNVRHGYSISGAVYSTIINCAADHNGGAGYASIGSSQNLTILGSGAENNDIGYFAENAQNLAIIGCQSVLSTNDAVRLDGPRQASLIQVEAGNTAAGYGLNIRTSTNSTTAWTVYLMGCNLTGTAGPVNDYSKIVTLGRIGGGGNDGIGVWDNASIDVPFAATIAGGQTNFIRLQKTAVGTWDINLTGADLGFFSGSTRVVSLDDLAPLNSIVVGQSAVTINNHLVGVNNLDITGSSVVQGNNHRVGGTAVDSRFGVYLTTVVPGDTVQGVGFRSAPQFANIMSGNVASGDFSYNAVGGQPYGYGVIIRNPSGSVTNNVGLAIEGQTAGGSADTALLIGSLSPAPGNWELYVVGTYPSRFDGVVTFNAQTENRVAIIDGSKNLGSSSVTSTELGYLGGATSAIQTQLNGKQAADGDLDDLADGSLTGSKVGTGINGDNITTGTVAEARIDAAIARDSEVAAVISDTAYDATSWNGVTTIAPSKNAVRDQVETMLASIAGKESLLGNSAGLAAAMSDETGSGLAVFNNSPVFDSSGTFGFSDAFFSRNGAGDMQMGADSGTPVAQTFRGAEAVGSNVTGGDFTIAGGRGTGSAAGGKVSFRTHGSGGTPGTSQGSDFERWLVSPDGKLLAGSDGVYSIGDTASGRPSTIDTTGNITSGAVVTGGSGVKVGSSGTTMASVISVQGTLNFGNTGAQSEAVLTLTLTGAAVGDVVALGVPNASNVTGGAFTAWVSATDTVSVKFCNFSSGSLDPASGTFRAVVMKF